MEECPYCKKPFKRLKSHLPHCKGIKPAGHEDQKALQSKSAALVGAKKPKRAAQDGSEQRAGVAGKHPEVMGEKPERPPQRFPLQDAGRSGTTGAADGDTRKRIQISFRAIENLEPKEAVQEEALALLERWEDAGASPGKATKIEPKSERRGLEPSKPKAALARVPVAPSLSVPERKSSSTVAKNIQAISTCFGLDPMDLPGPKLPEKALRVPSGGTLPRDTSSNLSHRGPSVTSHQSETRARVSDVLLGVTGLAGSAGLNLQENPIKMQVRGPPPPLGEGARESLAVALATSCDHSRKNPPHVAVPGQTPQEAGHSVSLSPLPTGLPCSELRVGSQASAPSLVALAMNFVSVEKTDTHLPLADPELQASPLSQLPGSGEPSLDAWHKTTTLPGGLLTSQPAQLPSVQSPPAALGLQWLPELYPAYLGLGMCPGKLQYWDLVALKPHLVIPQGESRSQVAPQWGRSSTGLRSLEPANLVPSNFSLTNLLAALQKGWVRCGASMKSGVGSVSMLFTGYFVLCCNWSFKHLKLQRWRK
ncbi:uncharacterized protein C17orf80 homolog [Suncus etruscus]|uniref:uncharacterized protein C17orf80 homolog n=1 Tax=Suncus etruscus TaxID=109475 RepID=UPI00210F988B|nr:uncharacterized protein C17orf80 homolog [Suncus etruscus]